MRGRIIKALADFYYVYAENEVYQCKAKGIFRKRDHTPLVGDMVEIEVTNAQDIEANIVEIEDRKSQLNRPSVANVDLILLVFAIRDPEPNFYLMDRFLVIMESLDLPVLIVFNKCDLDLDRKAEAYRKAYMEVGYQSVITCTETGVGIDKLKGMIRGRITSVAGPSGVGKSSIINAICGKNHMETGDISKKNRRGKQTTRHTELVPVMYGKGAADTFIVDTPGFSSTDIVDIPIDSLSDLFPEFRDYLNGCRFARCSHIHEPDCSVKEALNDGRIQKARYDNYVKMFEELKDIKKY